MNKKDRQLIFDKYNGRCAYCGCELTKGWHVDEIEPVRRKYKTVHAHWKNKETGEKVPILQEIMSRRDWDYVPTKKVIDGCLYPENYSITNQNPSCASCNINKHELDIEQFRKLITGFMKHLNEINTQYKIAKRYGLIIETGINVKFYFETI